MSWYVWGLVPQTIWFYLGRLGKSRIWLPAGVGPLNLPGLTSNTRLDLSSVEEGLEEALPSTIDPPTF